MIVDVVIPTIRQECLDEFEKAWGFKDLIVIWDNEDTYAEIERDLKRDAWIISRKNAAIRCYGYLQCQADVILTLDDDCLPTYFGYMLPDLDGDKALDRNIVKYHVKNFGYYKTKDNLNLYAPHANLSTAWQPTGVGQMRGLPYDNLHRIPEIMLSHGLWTENCDFDAITEIGGITEFEPYEMVVPKGMYFPMCSMNLAFKREILPLMFMPMMGEGWPYDRWDDIWCGVLAKKVLDHLGLGVWSGSPFVRHSKKSNKWVNLKKEVSGYEVNEIFWQRVDEVVLTKDSVAGAYVELGQKLNMKGDYWDKLRKAMEIWANLTKQGAINV